MESRSDFIRMAATVAVVAIAVYLALTFLMPHHEATPASAGVSADQVFASTADPSAAPPAESSAAQPLNDNDARKIGEEVGREVATQVAQNVVNDEMAKQAPADAAAPAAPAEPAAPPPEPTPAPVETAAAPAPEPVAAPPPPEPTPAPAPVSEPAAEPTPVAEAPAAEPAPAPAPAPKRAVKRSKPASYASAAELDRSAALKAPPAAEVLKAWWGAGSGGLTVLFVGQAAGEASLVVVLSSAADTASAGSQIEVTDSRGKPVAVSWQAGTSPRVLVARNIGAGRYTVVLAPALADSSGKTLGTAMHGPIYIR